MSTYRSTKTYGHEQGLSCCFRQWRATHSHCSLLHGYALSVSLEWRAATLDERNWVQDFGDLGKVKEFLKRTLDHKLLVAEDDPQIKMLRELDMKGLASIVILPSVGCEALARYIFEVVSGFTNTDRVQLCRVEVREHGANSAIYGD